MSATDVASEITMLQLTRQNATAIILDFLKNPSPTTQGLATLAFGYLLGRIARYREILDREGLLDEDVD
jgi:hypothetical protein